MNDWLDIYNELFDMIETQTETKLNDDDRLAIGLVLETVRTRN